MNYSRTKIKHHQAALVSFLKCAVVAVSQPGTRNSARLGWVIKSSLDNESAVNWETDCLENTVSSRLMFYLYIT